MEWSLPVYGCIKYSQFPVKKSSVKILNKTSYYCMQCWQKQILPPASHPSGFIYVLYFQFYVKILLLPTIYILFFAGNSWISQSKRLIFSHINFLPTHSGLKPEKSAIQKNRTVRLKGLSKKIQNMLIVDVSLWGNHAFTNFLLHYFSIFNQQC